MSARQQQQHPRPRPAARVFPPGAPKTAAKCRACAPPPQTHGRRLTPTHLIVTRRVGPPRRGPARPSRRPAAPQQRPIRRRLRQLLPVRVHRLRRRGAAGGLPERPDPIRQLRGHLSAGRGAAGGVSVRPLGTQQETPSAQGGAAPRVQVRLASSSSEHSRPSVALASFSAARIATRSASLTSSVSVPTDAACAAAEGRRLRRRRWGSPLG